MNSPYKLTIELVPRPLWFINLRKEMQRSAWNRLRKQVYKDYSYHCGSPGTGTLLANRRASASGLMRRTLRK